jgi:hypothetical protein
MMTVRNWAARKDFEYVFFDDRMFERVPAWYQEKVDHQIQLMSDLARLEIAKEFLSGQYQRTIWVDADVLVFDEDRFDINVTEEYAFCHEIWIEQLSALNAARRGLRNLRRDGIYCRQRVNNAVAVFTKGNSILEFYIHACKQLVKTKPVPISNLAVGTLFLTELHSRITLPLLTNVGLFSPHLMRDIASGGGKLLGIYREQFGSPIRAANLCASYANKEYEGVTVGDDVYHVVIDKLMETAGDVVNGAK